MGGNFNLTCQDVASPSQYVNKTLAIDTNGVVSLDGINVVVPGVSGTAVISTSDTTSSWTWHFFNEDSTLTVDNNYTGQTVNIFQSGKFYSCPFPNINIPNPTPTYFKQRLTPMLQRSIIPLNCHGKTETTTTVMTPSVENDTLTIGGISSPITKPIWSAIYSKGLITLAYGDSANNGAVNLDANEKMSVVGILMTNPDKSISCSSN